MIEGGTTKQQHAMLNFIQNYSQQTGYSPSYEEMGKALNLRSKSGVWRLINGLLQRGLITIKPGLARSVRIVSTIKCPHCGHSINL